MMLESMAEFKCLAQYNLKYYNINGLNMNIFNKSLLSHEPHDFNFNKIHSFLAWRKMKNISNWMPHSQIKKQGSCMYNFQTASFVCHKA